MKTLNYKIYAPRLPPKGRALVVNNIWVMDSSQQREDDFVEYFGAVSVKVRLSSSS